MARGRSRDQVRLDPACTTSTHRSLENGRSFAPLQLIATTLSRSRRDWTNSSSPRALERPVMRPRIQHNFKPQFADVEQPTVG
jgi:hypothetical protein